MITFLYLQIVRLRYWLGCAVIIFFLSFYGRKLQVIVTSKVDELWVAVCVFSLLAIVLLFLLVRREVLDVSLKALMCSFVLLSIGGLAVYQKYLLPVEVIHFLVFSLFGWLSQAAFGIWYGVLSILSMAMGDEILQHFLPDRVGDIHDVVINALSGLTGLSLRKK